VVLESCLNMQAVLEWLAGSTDESSLIRWLYVRTVAAGVTWLLVALLRVEALACYSQSTSMLAGRRSVFSRR
jgi:hypothetical protein